MLDGVTITWLGHGTFLLTTPEGKTILIDPWLEHNPSCPEAFYDISCDAMLLTHGHFDHITDVFTAHERCSGPIVGIFELTGWLKSKGLPEEKLIGMNIGGQVELKELDVSVRMVPAVHSSSYTDEDGTLVYLGAPTGFVVSFSNGKRIYAAGDTCVFGDMRIIAELYSPDLAILPIGDHFTMDPEQAAYACELLDVEHVLGGHYGTFDALTGTPAQLRRELEKRQLATKTTVHELKPGQRLGA